MIGRTLLLAALAPPLLLAAQAWAQAADAGADGGPACNIGGACSSASDCGCGATTACVDGGCCGNGSYVLHSGQTQTACCSGSYNAEFGIAQCTSGDAGTNTSGGGGGTTPGGSSSSSSGGTTASAPDAGNGSSGGGCGSGPGGAGFGGLALVALGLVALLRRGRRHELVTR